MRYLLAILLPPAAVLSCGKPVQAIINLLLTLLFWVPGAIHAVLVVHGYHEDQRSERIVEAVREMRVARGELNVSPR
jgi:uncharacterized membrane protein YqaE (UPF0057 family)